MHALELSRRAFASGWMYATMLGNAAQVSQERAMSEHGSLRERLQTSFVRAVVAKVDDALQTRAAIEPHAFWSVVADCERIDDRVVLASLATSVATLVTSGEPPPHHVDCRRAIRFESASGATLDAYFNAFGTAMRVTDENFAVAGGALVAALARLPHDAAGARARVILAPLTSGRVR